MMAKATGARKKARRFNCHAATTNTAEETAINFLTKSGVNVPRGSARARVRGLAASIEASARRLKAIAAERAATIATIIHKSWCRLGMPRAASIAPQRANGRAKTECSHLIISSVITALFGVAQNILAAARSFT